MNTSEKTNGFFKIARVHTRVQSPEVVQRQLAVEAAEHVDLVADGVHGMRRARLWNDTLDYRPKERERVCKELRTETETVKKKA